MGHLSSAALPGLAPDRRPLVDPRDLRGRVVHVGIGAFHRAHQAVYTEAAAAASGDDWGIVAVAPRSAGVVDQLRAQDHLFSVTERGGRGGTRVVGALVDARLMAPQLPELSDPDVTVVTLTVTEKGYRGPVVEMLARSLTARFRAHGAPIGVVSCDNMAGNGTVTRDAVRTAISGGPDADATLAWLDEAVAFPDTIVDRIVPATTDADRDAAAAALGVRDELAVVGEPYTQWVLQDSFVAPRPAWEAGGALFVPDVAPYALMKLRLLNGAHSVLAYLGLATGCETVADVLAAEWGEKLVRAWGAEVAPTLPGGLDADAYVDDLVERLRNPALRHLLRAIGCDGSLKIPYRWLDPLRERGGAGPVLGLALAAWVHATRPGQGEHAGAQVFGTTDPAAGSLSACWREHRDPPALVAALLTTVGAADLAADPDLTRAVAARLPALAAGRIDL